MIEQDRRFVKHARKEVESQAQKMLEQGMESQVRENFLWKYIHNKLPFNYPPFNIGFLISTFSHIFRNLLIIPPVRGVPAKRCKKFTTILVE